MRAITEPVNRALRWVPAWVIYVGAVIWGGWLFVAGASGRLGPEPIAALEHAYGIAALQFLVLGLAITPLMRLARLNLMRYRRAVGLVAFGFVVAHLMVWAVLDIGRVDAIWTDVVKRPYITVGMVGFVLMIPLAWTSRDGAVRAMGVAAWRRLHRLTYVVAVLGAVHFVMLVKGWQSEPLLYLAGVAALLLMRVRGSAIRRPADRASARDHGLQQQVDRRR